MTLHRLSIDLPYRPEDLFELAADVGRYPDFIKWIRSLRLLHEEEGRVGVWKGRAEVDVGVLGFHESFVSDVTADRAALSIDVSLVRGPFRRLRNTWRFSPIPTGARVDFLIDFVFRNIVLQTLAESNKDHAIRRIVESFTDEAARRFEKVATPV